MSGRSVRVVPSGLPERVNPGALDREDRTRGAASGAEEGAGAGVVTP
jgi:hypothetical protein